MLFEDEYVCNIIGDQIYVYENFLSKEEVEIIINKLKNLKDEDWFIPDGFIFQQLTIKLSESKIIYNRLNTNKLKFKARQSTAFIKLEVGGFWGEHSDNADFTELRNKSKMLKDGDPFKIVEDTTHGIIVYLNDDYEGGEIYYPTQNVIYKPKAGSLVIHSSEELARHGVKPVISGTRYSYSSNFYTEIKVPLDTKDAYS